MWSRIHKDLGKDNHSAKSVGLTALTLGYELCEGVIDVIDVGHIDQLLIWLLLLPQGIVGQYYLLPFNKGCPVYPVLC